MKIRTSLALPVGPCRQAVKFQADPLDTARFEDHPLQGLPAGYRLPGDPEPKQPTPLRQLLHKQPEAPPPDSFEPGFGRRLAGAVVGLVAAPALGLGLAALPQAFLSGPGASVSLGGGLQSLAQFVGHCSLPLLALGAGAGLAGGIAVAAGQSSRKSTLATVLGAGGMTLGAVGGATAGLVGLGPQAAMLVSTLVGGVAGAVAGYALGEGLSSMARA